MPDLLHQVGVDHSESRSRARVQPALTGEAFQSLSPSASMVFLTHASRVNPSNVIPQADKSLALGSGQIMYSLHSINPYSVRDGRPRVTMRAAQACR